MYNKSTRQQDTKASDAVTQYIYSNLYKHIYKEPMVVDNKLAQLSGIDIWDMDSNITIDEKCRITMIEQKKQNYNTFAERKRSKNFIQSYNTFAVELGWLRNGIRTKGWGLNGYNTPTYYNFIWLWETDVDKVSNLRKEHIRRAECLFVEKDRLQSFMKDMLGDEGEIWDRVNYMWDKRVDRVYCKDRSYHMTRSWRLHECPVCLVVRKDILDKLATHIYNVYINKYEVVK